MAAAAVFSHIGRKRKVNQDSYLIREDLGLFIVADGMGGHDNGKQASEMACDIIAKQYQQTQDVNEAVLKAHQEIQAQAHAEQSNKGMGTTLVILQQQADKLNLSWVGDSRAYQLTKTHLKQLTKDHSVVQQLLDKNLITIEEAKVHPKRHLLTQSIGLSTKNQLDIDSTNLDLPPGSEILLCTDGLTNELEEDQIRQMLDQSVSDQSRVQQVVELANDFGGNDNITAMLIRV